MREDLVELNWQNYKAVNILGQQGPKEQIFVTKPEK